MRSWRARAAACLVFAGCAGDLEAPPDDGADVTTAEASSSGGPSGTGAGLPIGTPHVAWLTTWGGKSASERVTSVLVEPNDDIVVTGTIGRFEAGDATHASVDAEDIVLARFAADGTLLASRALHGPSQNGSRTLARRHDGSLVMLGVFGATFPAFTPALETFGGPAVFVGAFASTFATLWGRALVGASTGRGQVTMSTTDGGSIVVGGTFRETLVTDEDVTAATGPSDAYVLRMGADGEREWLVTLGGPDVQHLEIGASAAVGEDVVIAGQLRGTLRTASGVELGHSGDAARAFSMRFDDTGDVTAFRILASTGAAAITRLVRRDEGLLAAVASGGAVATPTGDVVSAGEGDATLLWLDGAGAPLFGKVWGDRFSQGIASLHLDPAGNIVAAGSFTGTLDFGDRFFKTEDGRPDGFAVTLTPAGVAMRTVVATDVPPPEGRNTSSQSTSAAAWLSDGSIVACGSFGGSMRLGDATADSAGSADAFVARIAP
jgi:hypothetical protein